jgi:ComF family protein
MTMLRTLSSALAPPVCAGCGGHAGAAEPLCGACRRELRWLDRAVDLGGLTAFAPLAYEGPARAMVRALKFRGATLAAQAMAAQMVAAAPAQVLPREASPACGVLVPVPLHPRRLRRRGFNQAELLARAVAGRTGLGVDDCLARRGSARTQVGRDRGERLRGLNGSVAVRPDAALPRRAIVVDDVVTTGATLSACAGALRSAGVAEVVAIAYARTPGR